ncbi:uncharacterized protein TNIN_143931 [Trichonephila inaurata madagascariensis]|uniref:Uncharacterized protein n=1 Tax=Trichonephila inaurata madagascariensis TaxID=2747483 RepID=A0A8X7CM63_9ARAC|nr:uncharacterized protein TNIN_143931 [Trichonephila inaurata madagascariensis]
MDSLRKSFKRSSKTNSSNPIFELENFNLSSLIETSELESALLKRMIRRNFESLRLKMSTTGEILSKNLDLSTRGAFESIRSEELLTQNQFLFESLLRKFEETSLEIGERAKMVASNNFEGILQKISIYNNRVKRKFTPRSKFQQWTPSNGNLTLFLKLCLFSLAVVILVVFPDYHWNIANKIFENYVHVLQSTVLIYVMFIIYHYIH